MICLVIATGVSIFIALLIAIWIGSSPTLKDPDKRKEFLEHL
jgi:hypothetical protein